jgi:sugar lactone lactonase YvrE
MKSRTRAKGIAIFTALLFVSCAAAAVADSPPESLSPAEQELEGKPPHLLPATEEFAETIQSEAEGSQAINRELTDPSAAEGTALENLKRDEALELLEGVFRLQLESPSGPFDELNIEKFLSDNVAVIAPGDQPGASSSPDVESTLIQSTVPLRVETNSGDEAVLDLGLRQGEGELRPANPLVEVGLPQELGDGIELPEAGVAIRLVDAPSDRAPTTAATSAAFYPNVAEDTDFVAAPTLTGVETLTQVRSPAAPSTQTFALSLPDGAELHATKNGGAEVTQEEKALVGVAPPSAIDARGTDVPVTLGVSGTSLTLTIMPTSSTEYPVLLDPLFQTYEWYAKNTRAGINISKSGEEQWSREAVQHNGGYHHLCNNICALAQEAPLSYELPGLWVQKGELNTSGDHASWIYTVPRYFTDQSKYGELPRSYINHMTLTDLHFKGSAAANSPYLVAGLWDSVNNAWISLLQHEGSAGHGLPDMSWPYQFSNPMPNTNAKLASAGLWSLENGTSGVSQLYIGAATVELAEPANDNPVITSIYGPSQWVNQTAMPFDSFTAKDAGLGVYAMTIKDEQIPQHSWTTPYGCVGVGDNACPRFWTSTDSGHSTLTYQPSALAQGVSYLQVTAEDPLGHVSEPVKVQIKVDHTAPQLTLSGAMTEQAVLGTTKPSYKLAVNTADGSTESPQSGVAKTVIKVDGKVVDEAAPGCSTRNCAISREWTLISNEYASGQHIVEVIATDAVGLSTTKTLSIQLNPVAPPSLALSGTITEQSTLGTTRPRYILKLNAASDAESGAPQSGPPTYVSSFGFGGAGNGQFAHPAGIALDSKGSIWVVDENHYRVQKFNEAGEYLSSFGSQGTGNGQFIRPTDIAVDAKGNLWVTDAGTSRLEQFNEKGEYLAKVGSSGTGNGQFNGPESLAIDSKGNIWVGDTYNHRVQELNEKGEFIRAFGTYGSGQGQIVESTGIAIGPGGNVWVADWGNNRIAEFSETGSFIRQFGTEGTSNGQFKRPDVIDVDSKGNVWVGDQNNGRIQQFNQSGEYVAQFGTAGSGQGQFSFGYPMGIAADTKGRLWISDTNNNRVQKWQIPDYVPSYSSAFGTYGTGNGQFRYPSATSVDSKGNVWVADNFNHQIQKFNAKGEFLFKFGVQGTAEGQLSWPTGLAIDSKDNLWIADAASRIQKFNSEGKFLLKVGSAGSGNGQFAGWGPEGVAVDAKGNVWAADTAGGRLEEFTENGAFIRVIGAKGTGAGQLGEPMGLDFDPKGNVWVADWQNNRIAEFSETGQFIRQVGTAGTGNGQFNHPDGLSVDPKGNVWVADVSNNRIQQFNQNGEYITQFGTAGSKAGQFNLGHIMGLDTDVKGNIWIADTNNGRIQRWTQTALLSEISTETKVDGTKVDSAKIGCVTDACPVTREWALSSSAFSVGQHTVQVSATDALGRTTTKSLAINIQRDTTKPTLEASGKLFEAPEGWVEQESYALKASATDAGGGVTSLAFKIDGSTVTSQTQTCPDGGCTASLSKSINMASYSGGSHAAEIAATDGAGNTMTKQWTINVDPEGHITASEAEHTLEAADATSESAVVAPTEQVLESEQIEGGDNPGLQISGSQITSTGVPDTTTMTTNPQDGFTIHSPDGATTITPIVNENSSSISIAEGVAGVSANIGSEVDSVIRPEYNGVQTFQAIRSSTSPESYSWKVHLAEGQTLHYVNSTQAQVLFEDGTPSFLITAEDAHDATGATVPTSLGVNGDVLTLKVEFHSGTYVYPIVAGQGWETTYVVPVIVERPEDEAEIIQREKEEKERAEREAAEGGEGPIPSAPSTPLTPTQAERLIKPRSEGPDDVVAPPYPNPGEASASAIRTMTVKERHVCQVDHCAEWRVYIRNPSYIRGLNWAHWENETQVHCGWSQSILYAPVVHVNEEGCGFAGPFKVYKGEGKHLTIWTHFEIWALVVTNEVQFKKSTFLALKVWVWPNGFQEKVVGDYDPGGPTEN